MAETPEKRMQGTLVLPASWVTRQPISGRGHLPRYAEDRTYERAPQHPQTEAAVPLAAVVPNADAGPICAGVAMNQPADIAIDADALKFLGHVLEGYFAWASNCSRQGYVSFAKVMRIPQPIENRRVLNLSDDQFVRVDAAYAECGGELTARSYLGVAHRIVTVRDLIALEYTHSGSTRQKARRLGYEGDNYSAIVGQYRADLQAAERRVYIALMPEIRDWELENFERLRQLETRN